LGANLNARARDGTTPVYIASQEGQVSTVRALVSLGADINRPAGEGWTPLMVASRAGRVAVVAELLKAGACREAAANG
jgi:ankyrin repeat protein